jgi:hypothetical protein
MRYLIAEVEEGTPLDGLRRLGPHVIIDSLAAELDVNTEKAVAEITSLEREIPRSGETFEVVRIPLADAERLTVKPSQGAEIVGRVGPV